MYAVVCGLLILMPKTGKKLSYFFLNLTELLTYRSQIVNFSLKEINTYSRKQ